MITPDTSVVIAAFASWHEDHAVADRRVGTGSRLIAHVAAETLSALTRLPDPFRVEARPVWDFLTARFEGAWISLRPKESRAILAKAIENGVSGGAIYDAVIAGTASSAGATLLSLDRRAERTYRAVGVSFELLR